jgi:hypothetical protein
MLLEVRRRMEGRNNQGIVRIRSDHTQGGRCILTDLHFFNFFSLDGKFFATSKSADKNIFERKLLLLSLLRII